MYTNASWNNRIPRCVDIPFIQLKLNINYLYIFKVSNLSILNLDCIITLIILHYEFKNGLCQHFIGNLPISFSKMSFSVFFFTIMILQMLFLKLSAPHPEVGCTYLSHPHMSSSAPSRYLWNEIGVSSV